MIIITIWELLYARFKAMKVSVMNDSDWLLYASAGL